MAYIYTYIYAFTYIYICLAPDITSQHIYIYIYIYIYNLFCRQLVSSDTYLLGNLQFFFWSIYFWKKIMNFTCNFLKRSFFPGDFEGANSLTITKNKHEFSGIIFAIILCQRVLRKRKLSKQMAALSLYSPFSKPLLQCFWIWIRERVYESSDCKPGCQGQKSNQLIWPKVLRRGRKRSLRK